MKKLKKGSDACNYYVSNTPITPGKIQYLESSAMVE
jgi:hypothetical protein